MSEETLRAVRVLTEKLVEAARMARFGLHHAGDDRDILYRLIDAGRYAEQAVEEMRKEGIYE